MRYGYKASAEQFAPRELIDYSRLAEELGLQTLAVSDHFQPWRHRGGHTPAVLPWLGALGERTSTALLGTSVLTPTMRYHPSIIAQGFATLACLNPGRVFLGVGTGEALNETPATAAAWPGAKLRRAMLREAITLIRELWSQERVSFDGEYYRTDRATIYDKPEEMIPIYVAASGPLAAKLAGRLGDGFIATSGKDPQLYADLMDKLAEGAQEAGRDAAADRQVHRDQGQLRHGSPATPRTPARSGLRWRSRPTRSPASTTPSRWRRPPTRSSTAHTRASSSPTTPTRWCRSSPPMSRSASSTSSSTALGTTRSASCAPSAPTCCRACASASGWWRRLSASSREPELVQQTVDAVSPDTRA